MNGGVTVEFQIDFRRGRSGRRDLCAAEAAPECVVTAGWLPRVAKLMALAIRCEELVRSGAVTDYADLARLGHVTRARMTQIMNLLNLAPDIQEQILFLPLTTRGRDPISERDLRPICAVTKWNEQRRLWRQLQDSRHNI